MTEGELAFYTTAAQVLPVLLLALGLELHGFGLGRHKGYAAAEIPQHDRESPEEYFERVARIHEMGVGAHEWHARTRAVFALLALIGLVAGEVSAIAALAYNSPFPGSRAIILASGAVCLAILALAIGRTLYHDLTGPA